jgi:hypothetical protein
MVQFNNESLTITLDNFCPEDLYEVQKVLINAIKTTKGGDNKEDEKETTFSVLSFLEQTLLTPIQIQNGAYHLKD